MFKILLNLLSLNAPRTLSKIDDIAAVVAGVDEDCVHFLLRQMMVWMV